MGGIDVNTYTYHPKRIFDTQDIASDLQTKLRDITGGGLGDSSKIVSIDTEIVQGSVVVIVVTKH